MSRKGARPFTSHVKMMTLTLTLPHAGRWFYQREIQMVTGIAYTPVRAALMDLQAFGLLRKRTHGNRQYYMVEKDFFLYEDYKNIVLKTVGLGDHLRYRCRSPEDIIVAFIYGDFAEGRETTEADVEFCVVGRMARDKFNDAVAQARVFTQKEFRGLLLSPEEFAARLHAKDAELTRALAGKRIFLIGRPSDLDRLVFPAKA